MSRYRSKAVKMKRAQRIEPLPAQVVREFKSRFYPGFSRHEDKKTGSDHLFIYSYKTFKTYRHDCNLYVNWVKEHYPEVKTLDQCREHAQEYIDDCERRGLSSSSIKGYASAINKLHRQTTVRARAGEKQEKSVIKTPKYRRTSITRSRQEVKSDNRFSEKKNADLIEFCRSCGPRRSDVEALRVADIDLDSMKIAFNRSKGGKSRTAPYIGDKDFLLSLIKGKNSDDLVFPHVHTHADIHSFRADYASRLYQLYARPVSEIADRKEIYFGRKDLKGTRFDKKALMIVSRALGHNRISVVVEHYLY